MSTVPQGTPPSNGNPNVPQQVQTGGSQTVPPGKPTAVTGPGGGSISIPKVGKTGK